MHPSPREAGEAVPREHEASASTTASAATASAATGALDYLYIVCSPTVAPLPQASSEAHDGAACAVRAGQSALVLSDGRLQSVNRIVMARGGKGLVGRTPRGLHGLHR